MKRSFLSLFLFVVLALRALAPVSALAAEENGKQSPLQVRNAMGTILLSGLVGGILGLSTLSFFDQPQDQIRLIFFGAGAGMIVATLWMTFDVATTPITEEINSTWVPIVDPKHVGVAYSLKF